jgi:DNA polymerase-3 subunit gamma/tau
MTQFLSLYRKYRPTSFNEVIGQPHIINVLKASLAKKNISHAYLFAGSRGLGKTSVARIFARELGSSSLDTHEIDAASTRGIDDIRALKEEVNVLPRESSYKVYIVDEVHMLTKEAFNALLKTLEEPPRHVVFILATTELHKVPDTIISRCEVHGFIKPTIETLSSHVRFIASQEKREMSEYASRLIAQSGQGSYRDTLGYLQKVLESTSGQVVNDEDVRNILQIPLSRIVVNMLQAISSQRSEDVFLLLQELLKSSTAEHISLNILDMVRTTVLLRMMPQQKSIFLSGFNDDIAEDLNELAQNAQSSINSHFIMKLLDIAPHIRNSAHGNIVLEITLLEQSNGGMKK